ncbi:hypothetical protein N7492_010184 [Penicillium capsulatum]|uniref:Uncharacterized protein n=1 Tax=Penicillium capsulatum TaxID=69766 RepID=A0A9W9HQP5_9EURO|nr:hypothetical protein N7492_010184 [Penicillium capsulatum]KAJ6112692.1 hypothetical protein N7512_008016 [Penicillium capsulatum]
MARPIATILCGRTEKIGAAVIAALKPEFEVIHFIMTPEAGQVQIPVLLRGEAAPSASELGTRDYGRKVEAIILGGGYDDEAIQQLRTAAGSLSTVPWLRADTTKPTPPLGPAYGECLVARIKETVKKLQAGGEMEKDAVVWY